MKTATVRELRNNFAKLSRWIKDGEIIDITSRGISVAQLVPTPKSKAKKKKKLFDLVEHRKWMKATYGDKTFPDSIVLTLREEKDW